jgi:hypothetical protein
VLVWGAISAEGIISVKQATGVVDVLSVESMIEDLRRWQDTGWHSRTEQLRSWCNALFDLLGHEL